MFGLQDKRFLQFIENEFMAYETLVSNLETHLKLNKDKSLNDSKEYAVLLNDFIEAKKAFEIISEVAYKYKIYHNIKFTSLSIENYFSK